MSRDAERDSSAPHIFLIKVARHPFVNNSYLIVDPSSEQAVIVDPAWEIDKIQGTLDRTRATLRGVLITHGHTDHIDQAGPLAEIHGCPIWMSEPEIEESGFSHEHLIGLSQKSWHVGEMKIRPLLTPGHTLGSVCYEIGSNLFSGDVLFAEGCGLCDGADAAYAMYKSLEMLKSVLSPEMRIFPGHTYGKPPGQRFGDIRNYNIYLNFADRHSFAAFRLREIQSPEKILAFR